MGYAPPESFSIATPHWTQQIDVLERTSIWLVVWFCFFLPASELLNRDCLKLTSIYLTVWHGTYADVLPYLQHAFATNLVTLRKMFSLILGWAKKLWMCTVRCAIQTLQLGGQAASL